MEAKKILLLKVNFESDDSKESLKKLLIDTYSHRNHNRIHYYIRTNTDAYSTDMSTIDYPHDFSSTGLLDFEQPTIEAWADRIVRSFSAEGERLEYLCIFDEADIPEEDQIHIYVEDANCEKPMIEGEEAISNYKESEEHDVTFLSI